jgi:MoxR-like ATPase
MVDETMHPTIKQLLDNIENVIIGKREAALLSLVALLAEGHILLEDVPGVGKTKLVKTLAKLVGLEFKRIQFTPDLLPSDVTGVSVYNPKTLQFEFRPGPIMGNIILADEVNRTSPKTQSALLEGMEEGNVTIDGKTMSLPKPFFVLATQNPIEYEGTYPLPEAQLDRFLLKMKLGYPSYEEEIEVLSKAEQEQSFEGTKAVITKEELIRLQKESQNVYMDEAIKKYIISLVQKTREHPSIYLGVSPRGSIALMKAAKAYGFIQARDFVIPDDVQYLAPYILSHRMILISEAKFAGKSCEEIVQEIINDTPVPIERNLFS